MPLNLEPVGIVEGASRYPPHARPSFSGPHDGGSAPRTEFHSEPAIAFVGTMLVSHQRPTKLLDLLHFEEDRLRKSATGSPLAELAVTDRRRHRGANGSIAHAAAQTASFMDFTHSLRSGVESITSRGSDPALVSEKPWSDRDYQGLSSICILGVTISRQETHCQANNTSTFEAVVSLNQLVRWPDPIRGRDTTLRT